jgi:hypothetical protein
MFLDQMSESRGFPCLEQVTVGSLLVGEASLGWSCGVLSGLFGCFTVALGDTFMLCCAMSFGFRCSLDFFRFGLDLSTSQQQQLISGCDARYPGTCYI